MACRRARVPAEVVQFVADVRHVGAADDLAVARRRWIDVHDRDEVRLLDAGPLVQGGHVDQLLGLLLARHLGRRVAGAGVLMGAHRQLSFWSTVPAALAAGGLYSS